VWFIVVLTPSLLELEMELVIAALDGYYVIVTFICCAVAVNVQMMMVCVLFVAHVASLRMGMWQAARWLVCLTDGDDLGSSRQLRMAVAGI